MIRKAEKNGIEIHHGKGMELFEEFYESIHNDLHDNYEMFWAQIPDEGCEGACASLR